MSNRGRAGLVVLAVAIVAVAFIALRPSDSSDKADDPADKAAETTATKTDGRRAEQPTATAESAPPPPQEITLRDGVPQGGVKRIVVTKGDEVRLQVRTNEAGDDIHLHGYDIEKRGQRQAPGQLPLQGGHRGRLRDREPHRRGRGQGAADRAAGGRALLMLVIAHGIVGRTDLPIPEWLFGWAAAVVLVVSFVALAVLWPEPRLQDGGFRPLPTWLSRALTSRVTDVLCGLIGVGLLGLVVYAGFSGVQVAMANFASEFVFVVFWTGLVGASVLFGDIFRAFNPWRALGRFVAWISQTAAGGEMPAPLKYPERLGYFPAAVGPAGLHHPRAGGRRGQHAQERGHRRAGLLGRHVRRHGAVRRRRVVAQGRGVRRLLQPVLAHLAVDDPRRAGRACASRSRAWPPGSRCRAPCCCWRS